MCSSGVDHLIGKGWVDPKRVGCMGWSQGGYISAFLTTSSDRFAAISSRRNIQLGAYYYNTDITPCSSIQYLGAIRYGSGRSIRKLPPMTYIKQARTSNTDSTWRTRSACSHSKRIRVRQGLEDRGVPVEMIGL